MEISRILLVLIYVLTGIYIIYRLFLKRDPYQLEYERMYNEILTSDKNKVKGQYDKR